MFFCALSLHFTTQKRGFIFLPSAADSLRGRAVENAAYAGLPICFHDDWMKLGLVTEDRGRKAAGLETAMDREKLRGTERAIVRRDSIVNDGWYDD